jgi:hypothetical protein
MAILKQILLQAKPNVHHPSFGTARSRALIPAAAEAKNHFAPAVLHCTLPQRARFAQATMPVLQGAWIKKATLSPEQEIGTGHRSQSLCDFVSINWR